MNKEGSPTTQFQTQFRAQPIDCSDMRIAVVATSWHQLIIDSLVTNTLQTLENFKAVTKKVVQMPKSFELPIAASALAQKNYEAVVALKVIIRNSTPHFEYVCSAATDKLSQIALDHKMAIGFKLLTCDTKEQAITQTGLKGSEKDKDYEATSTALVTAIALREVHRARETK